MYALILLFLPALVGLICFVSGNSAKIVAFLGAILQLLISIILLTSSTEISNLTVQNEWIPSLGITFYLKHDNLSLILVLLTNILIPLIILSSFKNRPYSDNKTLYTLILMMQSALIGVFSAADCFLFYVFWEAALIPVYFISALWGGEDKVKITFKFFIYTIFGSLFMLLGIISIYLQTPLPHSFSWDILSQLYLSNNGEFIIFGSFLLAFAIKMPIFPLHTWQPDTYTTAPTPATMLLSGIMLKMGIFGVFRWIIPIFPMAFINWSNILIVISVVGIIYASIIAIQQKDFKRLIAFSSIAHVGLISAGLFTGNLEGFQGAIIQMFNHGINVVGMFFVLEIISQRTGTREIYSLGGIVHSAPKLAICFVIIMLGSVALPLTNGFAGEFLLLMSLYKYNMWIGATAALTIILGAVYTLRMYKNIMLGESNINTVNFRDLSTNEMLVLIPICFIILALGVYPNIILQFTETYSTNLVSFLNTNSTSVSNLLK